MNVSCIWEGHKFGRTRVEYYELNVCVLQNFYIKIITPSKLLLGDHEIIERWLDHGESLINEISVLIKKSLETSLTHIVIWGHREKSAVCTKKVISHQTLSLLGFPVFRTVRNKVLLLVSHPVYGIQLYQPQMLKILRYQGHLGSWVG